MFLSTTPSLLRCASQQKSIYSILRPDCWQLNLRLLTSTPDNADEVRKRKSSGFYLYDAPSGRGLQVETEAFFKNKENFLERVRGSVPGVRGGSLCVSPPTDAMEEAALLQDGKSPVALYTSLMKVRLSALVSATAMFGYALPLPQFDPVVFGCTALGTLLLAGAANALNQTYEAPYDAQMRRTSNRILVRGLLSPLHVQTFAAVSATVGSGLLWFGANPLTCALGVSNLVLYSFVYTPLKRRTIYNTWVGAVVGAIPPLMGWAAATGSLDPGAALLASLLFCWQFPHFNALSWNLKQDYTRAGYRMMANYDPAKLVRVTRRYSAAMLLISVAGPALLPLHWGFVPFSLALNGYLMVLAERFARNTSSSTARPLFLYTLPHLPLLMGGLLAARIYA